MQEINERLMNKINEVKNYMLGEIEKVLNAICKKLEDSRKNFVYEQSVAVFFYSQNIFERLCNYLKAQLDEYSKLKRIEIEEKRYDPFDYDNAITATNAYFAFLVRALCFVPSFEKIETDENHWASLSEVVERMKKTLRCDIDVDFLINLVENDRLAIFSLNGDKTKIHAKNIFEKPE